VSLALLTVAAAAAGILLWPRGAESPGAAPTPAAPVPPAPPTITAQQREAWTSEAAAAAARQIDDLQRQVHSVDMMLKQAQANTELIQSLAQGNFPEPAAAPASPPETAAPPYQSQYESLLKECLDYVRKAVPEPSSRDEAAQGAERWAAEKRKPLEEHMQGVVSDPLGL
jgi:hypothetical protein